MLITSLAQLQALKETVTLECKLAAGQDGKGKLPRDFWPTYSAFANAHGGVIVLGIQEKDGQFVVQGVASPEKLITEVFNNANNPKKVSANLLTDADISHIDTPQGTVLAVHVPEAHRKQKPVFLNGNPLGGNTYRRLHEGDRHCDDETVRRMLAEQVEDNRDIKILQGFGLADLDLDTLHAYRNMFASHKPDHPWNALDDAAFIRAIGGWRRDRNQKLEGLTLAGLLMFGQWTAITEACPNYFLDYQEQAADTADTADIRWLDRVVPDGTWSGNLFDFYRKVVRKLMADLKVPFVLKGNVRQDETPVHKALREALINTLVHADYTDHASLLVIKRPQGFLFRNPGLMRVPAETALHGGESDCRNRTLHQMFLMVGLGERAGSGLPKILKGWQIVKGSLRLYDAFVPYEQTRLEMNWPAGMQSRHDLPTSVDGNAAKNALQKSGESALENVLLNSSLQIMAERVFYGNENVDNALKSAEESAFQDGTIVHSTLKNIKESALENEKIILAHLTENPKITIAGLASRLGLSTRAIDKQINTLKSTGRLRRVGSTKGGHWEVLK